jgi:hypothetical protein
VRSRRALAIMLAVVPLVSWAAGAVQAGGAGEDPIAAAEALFQEGRGLLEHGDAHAACPKLAESLRLDRATGTLLARAMCHKVDGHLASAWTEYLEVIARAKRDGRLDREEAARQYAHALQARLSTLDIAVPAAVARIPGLVVQRDGVAVESTAWSTPAPIDPGPHVVSAAASGRRAFTATVVVGAVADHQTITVPLLAPDDSNAESLSTPAGAGALASNAGISTSDRPVTGASRFTTGLIAALAADGTGAAIVAELAVAHRAGWGGALRGVWPTSGRREQIDGGGVVTLQSFALRGWAFQTFRPDRVFSVQVGPEVLMQLDRADSSGLAGSHAVWRAGWGVGVAGEVDVPLASWVAIAVLASIDYAPAGWGGSVAVGNRGDVLRPSALRMVVGAGPRFTLGW